MAEVLALIAAVCAAAAAVCAILAWRKPAADIGPVLARFDALERGQERLERSLRDDVAAVRQEMSGKADALASTVDARLDQARAAQHAESEATLVRMQDLRCTLDAAVAQNRLENEAAARRFEELFAARVTDLRGGLEQRLTEARAEADAAFTAFRDSFVRTVGELNELGRAQSLNLDGKLDAVRHTVEQRLDAIRTGNEQKLEAMRQTVDEKLQSTLEARIGESFRLVSERLEKVHAGLGEMQQLATGVGDLRKVLTNVRTRGTWGEVQLGMLLEQVLAPDQYAANVPVTGTAERVEFAIRLPGQDTPVWLPIDSKFPHEDYTRLVEASEAADRESVEAARSQLMTAVDKCAKDIARKYIAPPATTNFAILFLPTESLYAEVLRSPGAVESLQRKWRVTIAGPTTLAAYLNSLQMGFRTLAIQKRSSEVWEVLGAAKTEFAKYGDLLSKVHKKLQEASKTIEDAQTRTRQIDRKLREVEKLPEDRAAAVLGDLPGDLETETERALTAGA